MAGRVVARFPCQTTYGEFGHLICTPCSFLVGTNFVIHQGLPASSWLTPYRVEGYMRSSHALYEAKQLPPRKVALEELQRFLPKGLHVLHAAGMTGCPDAGATDEALRRIEGLAVLPMHTLLTYVRRLVDKYDDARAAVLATSAEHTVCHTFDSDGRQHLFDPLGATLSQCRIDDLEDDHPEPYSGLVLFEAEPAGTFSVGFTALSHAASRA